MGAVGFVLTFALGTAALALWIDTRFPRLAPETLRGAIVHLSLAILIGQLALVPFGRTSGETDTFIVLFTCAVPALVYSFVAALWLFRLCQRMLGGAIR